MPFFTKHIEGNMNNRNIARPNNFEALKKNQEFRNLLGVLYRSRIYGVNLSEKLLELLDELIHDLELELSSRKFRM
jgi:hypothetical protein